MYTKHFWLRETLASYHYNNILPFTDKIVLNWPETTFKLFSSTLQMLYRPSSSLARYSGKKRCVCLTGLHEQLKLRFIHHLFLLLKRFGFIWPGVSVNDRWDERWVLCLTLQTLIFFLSLCPVLDVSLNAVVHRHGFVSQKILMSV